MPEAKAKLLTSAYAVYTLSKEWLGGPCCPKCGMTRWFHVEQYNRVKHTVRWAPPALWERVVHVEPLLADPSISHFSRREAKRALRNSYCWAP